MRVLVCKEMGISYLICTEDLRRASQMQYLRPSGYLAGNSEEGLNKYGAYNLLIGDSKEGLNRHGACNLQYILALRYCGFIANIILF